MTGKHIDSQLLDTQAITEPVLKQEEMKSRRRKSGLTSTLGFITGFTVTIGLVGIMVWIVVCIHKDQRTANTRLDLAIEQINKSLLPVLEEDLTELQNKIKNLEKETESLKDNCTDIRFILAPKFGKSVLIPIPKIRNSTRKPEEHTKFSPIKVPRNQ